MQYLIVTISHCYSILPLLWDPLEWTVLRKHSNLYDIRGRPYMKSAKLSEFWTPSPLSAFGTDLQYSIHATFLTTFSFGLTPLTADVIYGCPLIAIHKFSIDFKPGFQAKHNIDFGTTHLFYFFCGTH